MRVYPAQPTAQDWCVYRTWPDERVLAFSNCDAVTPIRQSFSRGEQGELLVFGGAQDGPYLYLLTYDARRNIPSGRIPGVVRDGVDVLRMDRRTPDAPPVTLAAELPLGGFDNLTYSAADATGLTICAIRSCYRVTGSGPVQVWQDASLSGYEIVEAVPAADFAHVLLRRVDDGYSGAPPGAEFHYAWGRIAAGSAHIQPIDRNCLPFALVPPPVDETPTWQCAVGASGMARLLQHEIQRMPGGGAIDYGSSNTEGRVAWSQAYYLPGLLELGGPAMAALSAAADWSPLRQRLQAEFRLLERLGSESAKGFSSRRYSLQRSELSFALHLGRIAKIFGVASRRGLATTQSARDALSDRLWRLDGTVEQPARITWGGAELDTLGFSKGVDFWCDGANVPYNYVSAYTYGLLLMRGDDPQVRARAVALLQPLLRQESLGSASTWNYWWGPGFDGWGAESRLSANTPAYSGSRGLAHISYRSLDALAVLRLAALEPASVAPDVVARLRLLVERGQLLPWVNSEITQSGRPVSLSLAAGYRYARSAGPWELEGQVWALERLASGL